jgi:hypothetical protein
MSWLDDHSFAEACRKADERARSKSRDPHIEWLRSLMDDNVSLERAYAGIHVRHFAGRAAESTVEALMLGLRERGTAALQEPKVRGRLAQLSEEQLRAVAKRLCKLKPEIAPPWSSLEIEHLLMAWRELTHG